jgi:hypothetical protein
MHTTFKTAIISLALISASECNAEGFSFQVKDPTFTVSIPGIPQMQMDVHPQHNEKPHLRYLGMEGAYTVSILTPTADSGMTALECASSTFKSLAGRPGVPPLDKVYKARINDRTFIAIYATPSNSFVQLHAHIMSAGVGTHCIEVHASMVSKSKDDIDPWFKGFNNANIDAN